MKLFWTQNEKPTIPNTIIIGDNISGYKGTEEQDSAMSKFSEVRSWDCEPAILEERGDKKKFKPWFNIAIKGNGIIIRSCFKSKDEAGRLMPYMYYSDTTSIETAIDDIKKYSEMVNKELDLEELLSAKFEISNYPQKKKKKIRSIAIVIIVLLTIIAMIKIVGFSTESSVKSSNDTENNILNIGKDSLK